MSFDNIPIRGTLLNTATVAAGSCIGLVAGRAMPPAWENIAVTGIGLVVLCLGVSMFLKHHNILVIVAAVSLGGVIGAALGIDAWLGQFAEMVRAIVGGGKTFNEGLISASVLYCVGPMTLLGCIQDGIEKKIELLALKSLLDGISSIFLAATLGWGVLVSAVVVLLVQGALTLAAGSVRRIAQDEHLVADSTATGGVLIVAIGLGLTGLTVVPAELFLPALVLAPLFGTVAKKLQARVGSSAL